MTPWLTILERSLGGGAGTFDPLALSALENALATGGNVLGEGFNMVGVLASDVLGNASFVQWQFRVVTKFSSVPLFDPLPSVTNQEMIEVKGRVPGGSPAWPLIVFLFVNGEPAAVTEMNDTETFEIRNVRLVEGPNELTMMVQDGAGNVSERSQPVPVVLDLTPPTIRLKRLPLASATPAGHVSGEVEDNRPELLSQLLLLLNGEEIPLPAERLFSYELTPQEGENLIQVKAKDAVGNEAVSPLTKVTLKVQPPTTAPASLSVRPTPDARGVRLSWSPDPSLPFGASHSGRHRPHASCQSP